MRNGHIVRAPAACLAASLLFVGGPGAGAQRANDVKQWEQFDFRSRTITGGQLKGLSALQLKYLRGILFGKHGRVFDEAAIQDWLKRRPWYKPDAGYRVTMLNATERGNMDTIKEAEHLQHKLIEPGDLKFYRDKRISKSELGTHSLIEWLIMREEIEAIHGKRFPETPWLQSFFEERYWYKPDSKYSPASLSDTERANIEIIAAARKQGRGVALAPGDMGTFQESSITPDLLHGLSLFELRLLRNEVYARHNKRFRTVWIQQHFEAEPWYHPAPGFEEPRLNAIEARNVELIVNEEQRLHEDLATRPLTAAALTGLFLEDARKLRNEIYARHGMVFKDRWLDSYFRSMHWYKPDPGFNQAKLTPVEQKNAKTLLVYERGAQRAANSVAA